MGFSHNPIWLNIFTPRIIGVERGRISAFFIVRGPIKIDENDRTCIITLGCNLKNIGFPQVPNDDILSMKETDCLLDLLQDNWRHWFSFPLELPDGLPIHTVHNDHVEVADDTSAEV